MTDRGTTTMDMDAMLDEVLDELDDDNDDDDNNGIDGNHTKSDVFDEDRIACFGRSESDDTKKEAAEQAPPSEESASTTPTQHVLIDDSTTTAHKSTNEGSIGNAPSYPAETFQQMVRGSANNDCVSAKMAPDHDERVGKNTEEIQSQIQPTTANSPTRTTTTKKSTTKKTRATKKNRPTGQDGDDEKLSETMSAILQEMAKAGIQDPHQSSPSRPPELETVIQQVLQSLQNDGRADPTRMRFDDYDLDGIDPNFNPDALPDFNADALMDGMMEQLLSKELMYEPMKQVTDKFPAWLDAHRDELTVEEFGKRTQQYECFCKLVEVYESPSDDGGMDRLMELMQQIQEFGQPPAEIVNEIAPGLELDEDGIPKMDGLPFGVGGEDGECIVM